MNFVKKHKMTILVLIIAYLFAMYLTPVVFQNDTFSAVKVGERIVSEGFPQYDNFSIHEGLTFTYPHWLFDVIVYKLHSFNKLNSLFSFARLLYFILIITLYYVCSKISKNNVVSFILIFPTILLIKTGIAVRAQVVSYILFLIEIYSIEKLLDTGKKRYISYLILISIAISNFHVAVWPFYFVLYLPYLVNFTKIKFLRIEYVKYKHLRLLLVPFALCLALGWINPAGLGAYTYSFKTLASSTAMDNVGEQVAPSLKSENGIILFTCLFFIYTTLFCTKTKIKLTDISMILGLTLMALMSNRHFYLLLIILPIYMTSYVIDCLKRIKANTDYEDVLFSRQGLVLIIGILGIIVLYNKDNLTQEFVPNTIYPTYAIANILNNNLNTDEVKLYSHYNFGSLLVYNDIKPFIDSRCDLYLDAYSKGTTVADDFFKTENGEIHYEDTFKKYGITHVLIYMNSSMDVLLRKDKRAKILYQDPVAMYFTDTTLSIIFDTNQINSSEDMVVMQPGFVLYEWNENA